ncbi:IS3 family transposase [Streptomyces europaeiscabiei]|uniref:IS3 family transposase n=1 Tax=Streptomyces europaeiscabiei TaxID=146819 RepID=UPI0038F81634
MTVHPFIEAAKQSGHSVKRACELLRVSRTAFYARRTGTPGPRAVRDAELTGQITKVHSTSRGTYGAPRIHAVLKREGTGYGRRGVARLMRAAGLQGRHRRRRQLTTTSLSKIRGEGPSSPSGGVSSGPSRDSCEPGETCGITSGSSPTARPTSPGPSSPSWSAASLARPGHRVPHRIPSNQSKRTASPGPYVRLQQPRTIRLAPTALR